MKIIATLPVRNEGWVLGASLRALLMWVNEVVILDHASTDDSWDIITQVANENHGRVYAWQSRDIEWEEMKHRQFLLDKARWHGATHIAIVDADEILTANLLDYIGNILQVTDKRILQLPWVCLARGLDRYYSSGFWYQNWVSCGFKNTPEAYWEARDGYDFHHRHPMGYPRDWFQPIHQNIPGHMGGLMHLQFVDERRLRAKQCLYKMTEVLRWPGREPVHVVDQRYNPAVYQSALDVTRQHPIDPNWMSLYSHLIPHMRIGEEPWQERKCRELVAVHGRERFKGLDLFGVV